MSCTPNNSCGLIRTLSILAAGFGAALAVGYCIYFDHQRRSDPNFRQRLRERRRAAAAQGATRRLQVDMPDPDNQDAVLRFFLDQVRNAEDRLAMGDMDGGAEYLSYAVTVCAQPTRLMQSLQTTLPPEAYGKLLQFLPENMRYIKFNGDAEGLIGFTADSCYTFYLSCLHLKAIKFNQQLKNAQNDGNPVFYGYDHLCTTWTNVKQNFVCKYLKQPIFLCDRCHC